MRERERKRESGCVVERESKGVCEIDQRVCVSERERERKCGERLCESERERKNECVCVRAREREGERDRKRNI